VASTKKPKNTRSKSDANIGFEAPFEHAVATARTARKEMHPSGELRIPDIESIVGDAT
jgi:hypothetical protein